MCLHIKQVTFGTSDCLLLWLDIKQVTFGTSDCLLLWLTEWKPELVGDAYINAVYPDQFFCLVA
jgi:hypothetical protein